MKHFRRYLAALLCLILILTAAAPAAIAAEYVMQDIPIIHIPGTSNTWIYQADGTRVVPSNTDLKSVLLNKDFLLKLTRELWKAEATNRWDDYCDTIYDALIPALKGQALDKNGDAAPGTYIRSPWSKDRLPRKTSGFGLYDYYYQFDHRVDPRATAEDLADYIDAVLEVTGKPKVALIGRCYGACVAAAYLAAHGGEGKVDSCVLYCPMTLGIEYLDAIFTGNIVIDPDDLDRFAGYYLEDSKLIGDEALRDLVIALISLMNANGTLDLTVHQIMSVYNKVKTQIMPRILRETFATWPCYWAMVGSETFDEAVRFVFGGNEAEYAGLMEKITAYQNDVKVPLLQILDALRAQGMKLSVIAKYNTPQYPLYEGANAQSDNSNSLYRMSFGGTASPIDKTLPDSYLRAAVQNGTAAYISPDCRIDASTCHYPDNTWFIKNAGHLDHSDAIMEVALYTIRRQTQATIRDDAAFPQYSNYDKATRTRTPLTGDDTSSSRWNKPSFFASLRAFLRALWTLLQNKLRG